MDSKMQTKKKKGWTMGRILSGMMLLAMFCVLLIPQSGIKVQAAKQKYARTIDTINVRTDVAPEDICKLGQPTTVPTVTVSDDGAMGFFNANGRCISASWYKWRKVLGIGIYAPVSSSAVTFDEGYFRLYIEFRLYDDDNKFGDVKYSFAEDVKVTVNGSEWSVTSAGLRRNEEEGYTYFQAYSPNYHLEKTITGTGFSFDTETGVMTLSGNVDKDELRNFEKKDEVLSVVSEAGTKFPTDCSYMFRDFDNCTSMDLSNVNTASTTNMEFMFYSCSDLISLDISGLDMRHVTNEDRMLAENFKLTSLRLGTNFSDVTDNMRLNNGVDGWCKGSTVSRISGTNSTAVFSNSGTNWYHKIAFIDGSVKVDGTAQIGETLTATVTGANTTKFKYQWKRGEEAISGATSSSYKIVKADAGMYIYCEVSGSDAWISGSIQNNDGIKVDKMAGPAKPTGLTYDAPSKKGRTDAIIYGVNDTMQYSRYSDFSNANSVSKDSDKITGLGAGTYYIRVKETESALAGAYATVKIPEGQAACYTFSKGVLTLQGKVENDDIKRFDKKSEVKSIVASNGTILSGYCYELFSNYDQCVKIDLSKAKTSQMTSMEAMFRGCSAVKTIDLSGFDTSNVENFSYLFSECTSLTKLNLSHFDTSNAKNMSYMFYGCEALSSLNINNFKTGQVANIYYMFYNCKSLKSLNLASFDMSQVKSSGYMFSNCDNLSTLTLGAKFGKVSSDMYLPNGGFGWSTSKDGKNSVSGTSTYAEITNTKKTTYYKIAQMNGIATISGKTIYKQTLTVNVTDSSATNFKYQWKRGKNDITNATGKSYKLSVMDIGNTISCEVWDADGKYEGSILSEQTADIEKLAGPKAPTGLTAGAPTKLGRDDGMIYGVTDLMEYSGYSDFSSSNSVNSGNDTIGGLKAGTYYVRIKETETTKAGASVKVTVPKGQDSCFTYSKGVLTLKGRVSREDIANLDVKNDVKTIIASEGTILPESCYELFYAYSNCTKIDLSKADTSSVKNMGSMFYNCSSLKSLNLSSFDTSKVTNMQAMFRYCGSLTKLIINNFDTSKVINMENMFSSCSSLKSLDLSSFTIGTNTNAMYMFYDTELSILTIGPKFGNVVTNMYLTNRPYGWVKGKTGTKVVSGTEYCADIKNTTKTTYYRLNAIEGSVNIDGTFKVNKTITANVTDANTDKLLYQWKRNGEPIANATEVTYKLTKNDIGNTIVCVVTSSDPLYAGELTSPQITSIEKADSPAAPKNLAGVATSKPGASDGKITGVKTTMEYSTDSGFYSNVIACTSTTIEGLPAGTYYVRLKETASAYAGKAAEVVVEEGKGTTPKPTPTPTPKPTPTPTPTPGPNPSGVVTEIFKDVKAGEWYVNAVQFVYDKKIMNGTGDNTFSPLMTLTRGQFVTILYNMENRPKITFKGIFSDVKSSDYFALPVEWAAKQGITSGTGKGEFSPNAVITREQLAVMFYKYAQVKGYKTKINSKALDKYPDIKKIDEWALEAMKWAVTNGVMSGKATTSGKDILDPLGKATRAECAQMVKNLFDKAMK